MASSCFDIYLTQIYLSDGICTIRFQGFWDEPLWSVPLFDFFASRLELCYAHFPTAVGISQGTLWHLLLSFGRALNSSLLAERPRWELVLGICDLSDSGRILLFAPLGINYRRVRPRHAEPLSRVLGI